MQQVEYRPQSDQQANRGGAPRSQVILIVALLLFSVAGLASGFSVGALTKPKQAKQNSPQSVIPMQPQGKQQITPQATKTVDILALGIGCPNLSQSSYTQIADNTTTYTINAQVMDKSKEKKSACGIGKPLLASGITCKMWLTKDQDSLKKLNQTSHKMLVDVKELSNAFPNENTNAIVLNGNNQVKDCNSKGTTTWKYSITSNTDPGVYFLAVLTDWKGQAWNWRWIQINVTKAK